MVGNVGGITSEGRWLLLVATGIVTVCVTL